MPPRKVRSIPPLFSSQCTVIMLLLKQYRQESFAIDNTNNTLSRMPSLPSNDEEFDVEQPLPTRRQEQIKNRGINMRWKKMRIRTTTTTDNGKIGDELNVDPNKDMCNSRLHRVKSLLGHTPTFLVSLIIFFILCGSCLAIIMTISKSRQQAKEEEAMELAIETGQYFSDQLDGAILPLFSMGQFATNLEIFQNLPDKIGAAGEPNALPLIMPQMIANDTGGTQQRVYRNVTGVCDEPELVSRFVTIASGIKTSSNMDEILVNIQLAPAGVVCLLHPMNNTEDFEDGKYLDNTGAWGLDLLNDPLMKYIALESLEQEDVGVAGPLSLIQCPTCGDFFIARLPIVDPNHSMIGADGNHYPRWGFATAIIDWTRMVDRSGIYDSFDKGHGGHGIIHSSFQFRLTRTDRNYDDGIDAYTESVVVLAESSHFQEYDGRRFHKEISVALETTNNEWEMHVRYSQQGIVRWTAIVSAVCVILSVLISWLVYTALSQKQMHASMQAETSAQEAKVETERNMTAYFAHELRNPLSAMDNALQTINEEELPQNSQELIRGMKLCSSFMSSIMNNLLDARKLQEGMMEIRSSAISLSELVDGVYTMMLPLVKSSVHLKVEKNFDKCRDWVLGDKHRIQQILINMVTNSVKYTFAGTITLKVSWSAGDKVCMEVIDTGPGIPKREQERLFERFVQRGGAPGTGLGLAISKQIVTMMGGTIRFESDPTIQPGTNCIVTLPLEMCKPIEDLGLDSSSLDETRPILEPISILIMDDVKLNRLMLERRIKKAIAPNAEIISAVNGEEALETTSQRKFDIIICDQYMEESGGVMVGTDVIIALRRDGVKSVIVGCSGNDLEMEFNEAGADLVWKKPMPANNEIIKQFRQCLQDRGLR